MQQFNSNHRRKQQQEQIDLLALIRYRYLSYWPLFILAAALGVGAAMLYLRYATATYKVSATLLVKEESKKLGEKDLLASLDLFGSDKNIENEMQILYSRTLATEVAKNLQLYGEVFQKGQVHDLLAYENAPLQFRFLQPEKIKPGKPEIVPFVYNATNATVSLNNKAYPLNDTVPSPWGNLLIKAKPGVSPEDHHTYYLQITDEKQLTQVILSRLSVAPVSKMGTVIKLEYADVAPKRGEDILNELIRVYNAAAIEDKNRVAASTMSFVDDRLRIVSEELNQVEGKVESFKRREGIVDISEQSKLFLESVQENDSKMSEANMQLSVLESIEKYVSGKGEGENIVPATLGLSDPVLMELVAKLYETDMERERLKKTTGENSPVIGALNRQIAKLTPSILENINSLRNNLNAGKEKLEASNSRFMGILRSVPGKERALVEVSREREIKNNIYTFLLQKREETALAYAAAISDSRIVDAAEASSVPFSPKRMTVLAMAVIAGIIIVAAIITIKDMMNREIVERAEIEKATAAPIVAEIMYDDNKESIVITDGKRSLVAEQFRSLRTSLSYIGLNGDNKTLLVTSSISGEGKSFVSINLAASISLIRKKVVLLEFDLRKPMISKMLGITREPGITNYLVGVGRSSLSDLLRPVPGNDYLFVLPAGVIPPNPTELILNGRLEEMLTQLKTMFDYVIIDTAPVGIVTDARLLAPFADACLYVLRQQVTPKMHLKLIDELYRNKEVGKLNLVFNGVRPRGVSAHGYGYGYGYVDEPQKNGKRKRFIKNIFNI